jgi:hypothetical protein
MVPSDGEAALEAATGAALDAEALASAGTRAIAAPAVATAAKAVTYLRFMSYSWVVCLNPLTARVSCGAFRKVQLRHLLEASCKP